MEKYTHRRNAILGIIKAHYNIVTTNGNGVHFEKYIQNKIFSHFNSLETNHYFGPYP